MDFKTVMRLYRINVMRRRRAMTAAAQAPAAKVTEVGGLSIVAFGHGATPEEAMEEAVKAANASKKPTIQ
jgi:hypothetical protein